MSGFLLVLKTDSGRLTLVAFACLLIVTGAGFATDYGGVTSKFVDRKRWPHATRRTQSLRRWRIMGFNYVIFGVLLLTIAFLRR